MKLYLSPVLIVLICFIILAGCTTNLPGNTKVPSTEKVQEVNTNVVTVQTGVPGESHSDQTTSVSSAQEPQNQTPGVNAPPTVERQTDMGGFISTSFPKVTGIYIDIKKSRNALEWKQVQEKALKMQLLIQDLTKTYQLDVSNPEKNVFKGLDSREQIVFLKYLEYLDDMESYATNLKNAVYYQEKGSDPQSAQTSLRYQGQADQFEKQVITEVKTISEYCNDFKYSFLNQQMVSEYRFVG